MSVLYNVNNNSKYLVCLEHYYYYFSPCYKVKQVDWEVKDVIQEVNGQAIM